MRATANRSVWRRRVPTYVSSIALVLMCGLGAGLVRPLLAAYEVPAPNLVDT